jgi:hypothetical protein
MIFELIFDTSIPNGRVGLGPKIFDVIGPSQRRRNQIVDCVGNLRRIRQAIFAEDRLLQSRVHRRVVVDGANPAQLIYGNRKNSARRQCPSRQGECLILSGLGVPIIPSVLANDPITRAHDDESDRGAGQLPRQRAGPRQAKNPSSIAS